MRETCRPVAPRRVYSTPSTLTRERPELPGRQRGPGDRLAVPGQGEVDVERDEPAERGGRAVPGEVERPEDRRARVLGDGVAGEQHARAGQVQRDAAVGVPGAVQDVRAAGER